jgi:hypothetical protein
MKPYVKAIGIAALAIGLFSFKKYIDYSTVINQMQFFVDKIKNLRQKSGKFYFDFDLVFFNPTDIDFMLETAGLIKIKQIDVFYKGKKLGTATSDVSQIYLPAKTGYRIKDITIELVLLDLIGTMSNGFTFDTKDFLAQVTVEALGKTFIVDQQIT